MSLVIKDKVAVNIAMLGTSALIIQPDGEQTIDIQRRIWAMGHAVEQWAGVREIVFGMTNLMVVCETHIPSPEAFSEQLTAEWHRSDAALTEVRLIEIPTTYGGELAVDIEGLIERTGLDLAAIAQLHAGSIYDVFAVGSAPGFAYLGGLNPRLFMPRKKTPSLRIEKGSLTIGGMQTAISSLTGPNGWNAIGCCDVELFDISKDHPCLLAPGDRIRFVIDKVEAG
ncbi:5-oxoprolinase subunit PxpB [Nguyenibacter sp. L1]|uniref:5-oxoprolinase subunit PxpB n=1 Tax=Nguyenibacter sp. L1 TaxID=3049350 RepID=UPI002B46ED9E|nr:5-oxoprolinase subunit PxpB [Nguyenibacter sp. L1]WRH89771.1 5-oxoprolinase subunit PxpB [Nguyenibacter sp. L1]